MALQAQVEIATGHVLALGTFPGGSPDPATIAIVSLTPEQETAVLSATPGQRVLGANGVVTILPPPPPPLIFTEAVRISGSVRTTDATPTEVYRLTLLPLTGYTGIVTVIGVDTGNGAVRVIRASFAVKRLNAGALAVGSPVVLASHADAGATTWQINASVTSNDALVTVTGAAGRVVDWSVSGEMTSFTPAGR